MAALFRCSSTGEPGEHALGAVQRCETHRRSWTPSAIYASRLTSPVRLEAPGPHQAAATRSSNGKCVREVFARALDQWSQDGASVPDERDVCRVGPAGLG